MTELEQRIADELDARMRVHNLKQARERVEDAARLLRLGREIVNDDTIANRVSFAITAADDALWWIDLDLRDDKGESND